MGTPIAPSTPVLMIASVPLSQWTQAGKLPNISTGQAFWAKSTQVASLVANGQATVAPANTPVPPAEPAYTAGWTPGLGAGTSNSSH